MGTIQQPLGSSDLGAVLDSLREGIQIVDSEWRYVYVNNAAAEHGRRDKSELIGRTMLECFPGIDQTPMFGVLRACMHAKIPGSTKNDFVYPDGTRRMFELQPSSSRSMPLAPRRSAAGWGPVIPPSCCSAICCADLRRSR